jgi:hypothetical protein
MNDLNARDDDAKVAALRRGDEAAFTALVREKAASMFF